MCAKAAKKPIIADGGIRVNGDFAKSIRFGATMCMSGASLAAYKESPGKIVLKNNTKYKEYYGSASEFNKEEKRYVEGVKELIKLRGSLFEKLDEIKQDLQSSISYSGGNKLFDLTECNYVILNSVNDFTF